jgi:hypothetical protein
MAAFSARNARIIFDSVNLLGLTWTINAKVDEVDVSNFEGEGYADYIGGLWEADISFDAIHYGGSVASTTLFPGRITSGYFYLDAGTAKAVYNNAVSEASAASGRYFYFSSLLVTSINVSAEIRSFVKLSVSAKNKGKFTYPMP